MKLAYLGAACGAALLFASAAQAAPAGATTVLSGYVDADYGYMNVHVSGFGSGDVNAWGGRGAVAFPVTDRIGVQLDGVVNDFQAPHSIGGGDQTIATPSGHVFYRNDQWLAGAFAGAEIAPHVSLVGGGLEGQYYASPNITIDGSVGYAGVDHSRGADVWGVRLGGKGFLTDNLSVGANVNYVNLSASGASANLWTESVNGEWKLDRAPVAFTLAYEHGDLNKVNISSDAVMVGVRWTFDGSLRDREHRGASLPSFTQAFGGEAGQALVGLVSAAYGFVF
jgi:hypothetical protein